MPVPKVAAPDLSIIVPVFNEQNGIRPFLTEMAEALAPLSETVEFVFVDDGSSDGTTQEVLACQKEDPRISLVCCRAISARTPPSPQDLHRPRAKPRSR